MEKSLVFYELETRDTTLSQFVAEDSSLLGCDYVSLGK